MEIMKNLTNLQNDLRNGKTTEEIEESILKLFPDSSYGFMMNNDTIEEFNINVPIDRKIYQDLIVSRTEINIIRLDY